MPLFRESTSKGTTAVHLDLSLSDLTAVAPSREPLICYSLYFKIFSPRSVFPFPSPMLMYICIYSNTHKYMCIYISYITHIYLHSSFIYMIYKYTYIIYICICVSIKPKIKLHFLEIWLVTEHADVLFPKVVFSISFVSL